nr:hypothetical conserved protein [uncultured Gammaproteobacteria bacterium]
MAKKSVDRSGGLVEEPLDIKRLTELLIRYYGIDSGYYELAVEFGFAAGRAGPSEAEIVPTAFVGVQKVGLIRVEGPTPMSVDAAQLTLKQEGA